MHHNPLYLALDLPRLDAAEALARKVKGHVGGFKLGLEFFCAHGHHGVHLDREVHRQAIDAHGRAGMATGVAERLDHEVRAAVHDLRDFEEAWAGLDKAAQLDHSRHPVEVALAGGLHLGQQRQATEPGRALGGLEVHVLADHALDAAVGVQRHLAGDVD